MNSIIEISKKGFFPFKFKTRQTYPLTEEEELKEELLKTKKQIDMVFNAFENTTEKDLIDSCIYEMKALQTKYKYYLNKMKEKDDLAIKELGESS
ncbi:MAG: DUF2508 family protein [Epulopiscium sp.]|nr:DUF2508 family protein [Candidatus Epulonipiscium sp.]